jgi:CHAD domain-containing protein
VKKPYRKLNSLRRRLLRDYDAEKLHKLRIALRRMRSTLRSRPQPEARQLREELGLLADTTNAARDWDTLAVFAADHLKKKQYRRIAPWLEERCRSAHQRVIRTLRSEQWSGTMKHWKHYTLAHQDNAPAGEVIVTDSGVDHSLARLAHRLDKALSQEDAARWHKVRIAVKDLRYQLDARGAADHQQDILLCKRLQEHLGRWHDCVVHDRLLRSLIDDVDTGRNPRASKVLKKLRHTLVKERRSSLASARAVLTGVAMKKLLNSRPQTAAKSG